MNDRDNSPKHEKQQAVTPANCRALLAMTRPLVIVEDTPLSSRDEKIPGSGFGFSPEPADSREEFTLRKGEIIRPDKPGPATAGDEGLITKREETGNKSAPEGEDGAAGSGPDSPETDSDLQMRIYLGMS